MANRTLAAGQWRRSFSAPLVTVLALTTIAPFIYTVIMALGSAQGDLGLGGPLSLDNFAQLLSSAAVWKSLFLAAVFLIGALVLELIFGVFTALLVHKYVPAGGVARMLLLWPAILPPVAVALIFKFILQGDVGMVSYYLARLGYDQAWLTQPTSALVVIIIIDVWQYTPFVILLTLAALQGVPEENYEAAALDGASGLKTARHVLLPMIRPALISVLLLRFIDAIQVFPTIYILTRGGPGSSTQLLTYYNFQIFFGELQFGLGAAMSVIVVVFTIGCVTALMVWQRRTERRL